MFSAIWSLSFNKKNHSCYVTVQTFSIEEDHSNPFPKVPANSEIHIFVLYLQFIYFCFVQKCQSRNEHHLLNSYKTFRVHCIVTLFRYVVRLLYLHHRLAVVHHEFSKKKNHDILPLSISYTKNYSATT